MTRGVRMILEKLVISQDLFSTKTSEWRAEVRRILDCVGDDIVCLERALVAASKVFQEKNLPDQGREVYHKLCVGFAQRHPEALIGVAVLADSSEARLADKRYPWSLMLEGFATLVQGPEAALRFYERLAQIGLACPEGAVMLMVAITLTEANHCLREVRDRMLRLLTAGTPEQQARAKQFWQLAVVALRHTEVLFIFCPYSQVGRLVMQNDGDAGEVKVFVGVPDEAVNVVQAICDQTRAALLAGLEKLAEWLEPLALADPVRRAAFIARQQEKWAEIRDHSQIALHPEERISLERFEPLRASGLTAMVLRRDGYCHPCLQVIFKRELFGYRIDRTDELGSEPFSCDDPTPLGRPLAIALWGLTIGIYHSLVVRGDPCFGEKRPDSRPCVRSFRARRAHTRNPPYNGRRQPKPGTVELAHQRAEADGNGHLFHGSGKSSQAIYVRPSKPVQSGKGWSLALELTAHGAEQLLKE